jgi:hypothetical protein
MQTMPKDVETWILPKGAGATVRLKRLPFADDDTKHETPGVVDQGFTDTPGRIRTGTVTTVQPA